MKVTHPLFLELVNLGAAIPVRLSRSASSLPLACYLVFGSSALKNSNFVCTAVTCPRWPDRDLPSWMAV